MGLQIFLYQGLAGLCKAGVFCSANDDISPAILDVETERELGQVKKIFQGRRRRVKMEEEMGEGRPAPSVL